jgi:[ribosomal protein S5]-alanine N-acetyltransferase
MDRLLDMITITPTETPRDHAEWRQQLPILRGARVDLRELRAGDAPALYAIVNTEEVARFISPPPPTVPAFEQFITLTRGQQALGRAVCFAVTLKGCNAVIGLFQVRDVGVGFKTAEWGFAIASPFWGTGIFEESAHLVLDFIFNDLGVHRLEARAAVRNGRGNRALLKLGAAPEGVMRQALLCGSEYVDQTLYGMMESDWRTCRQLRTMPSTEVVH